MQAACLDRMVEFSNLCWSPEVLGGVSGLR
jgi:hypothetical protein